MPTRGNRYGMDEIAHAAFGMHNQTASDEKNTATAEPPFRRVGGYYREKPTANGNNLDTVLWVDAQGYSTPNLKPQQIGSWTTLGSSTNNTTILGVGAFKDIDFIVDVQTLGGDTATLNVYIDSRMDGTSWTNIARFGAITTAGTYAGHVTKRAAAGSVTQVGTDAGAGTFRAMGWADDIRVRRIITGDTGTHTGRIWMVAVS